MVGRLPVPSRLAVKVIAELLPELDDGVVRQRSRGLRRLLRFRAAVGTPRRRDIRLLAHPITAGIATARGLCGWNGIDRKISDLGHGLSSFWVAEASTEECSRSGNSYPAPR